MYKYVLLIFIIFFQKIQTNNLEIISLPECGNILSDIIKELNIKPNKPTKIIHYRDPRDLILIKIYTSCSPWIKHKNNRTVGYSELENNDLFKKLFLEYSFAFQSTFKVFYQLNNSENTYIIKLEDIYGPKGIKIDNIKKMCSLFKLSIKDEELNKLKDKIKFNFKFFMENEVGFWRPYFPDYYKVFFKKNVGQLLIDLGYEKDLNW